MMFFFQYLAFESPTLDLDITLFIQFGLFVLVMLALRKFVLKPYLRALDEREARTTGAKQEAKDLQTKAAEATQKYEAERQKAYGEAESERRAKIAKANEDASSVIEAARKEVQADIASKQAQLDAQIAEARRNASPEIDAISSQIAQKILV